MYNHHLTRTTEVVSSIVPPSKSELVSNEDLINDDKTHTINIQNAYIEMIN